MKRKINSLSVSYMLFLIILFLSGSTKGIWSEVVYFAAFVVPFVLSIMEIKGEKNDKTQYLTLDREAVKLTLISTAPAIAVVLSLSLLTSSIVTAVTGATNNVQLGNSLILAIIYHALAPALLEEMLFRYLPMRLLANHSKRVTVFVSALFFALIHHSFFSMPYAFVAGVIFMVLDLMCESIWPSVIIHFLNNTLSVLLIFYSNRPIFVAISLALLGICATVSLIFFILKRKKYLPRLHKSLSAGEKFSFNFNMLIFSLFAVFVAILTIV